jgi:hypothetical protein
MASRSLGTLTVDLIAKTGGFKAGMTQAERQADKSARAIQKRLENVGRAIDATFAAAATAAVAAAGVITAGVSKAIDRMDELGKSSQKIGVTTESLSKLAFAAQLADVEFSQLESALVKLSKSQDAAVQGTQEQLAVFQALNVEFKNADGTLRRTDEVFSDLADAFQRLPDGANKTAAALALFGRSGAQLIPLLNDGAEGLREAGDELERFGGVVTPEAAAQAEQFNDDLTRLKTGVDGLWQAVAQDLLPDLVNLVEGFKDGAKEGDGFNTTAESIAGAIRGIAEAAAIAFNTIKTMTLGIVGLTASAASLAATYSPILRSLTTESQRQGLDDLAAVSFAGAEEARNRVLNGPEQGVSPFSGSRRGRAEATRDSALEAVRAAEAEKGLAAALEKSRGAAAASAAAKAANAAAAREAARVAKEQEKREAKAAEELLKRQMEQMEELQRLASIERQEYQRDREQAAEVLDNLRMENELMGLNNLEREKAIALKYAGANATEAEKEAIVAALDELDRSQKIAEGLDVVRDSTRSLFSDLMSGAKSAKDAFMDFVDSILAGIAEIVARNLTEQLFGSFGSTGGGSSGNFLGDLFGAFFAGGRASGGTVYPGKAYLVGEQGPELVVPSGMGHVMTADKTAKALRRGTTNVTFVLPGRNDLRTEQQRQADLARVTGRQLARGTA